MRNYQWRGAGAVSFLTAAAVVLAACGAPDDNKQQAGDGDGKIQIGIIAPFTGPLAAAAKDLNDGWELYWKERGNTTVAGQKVEWVTADDANNPATGVTQAKSLVSTKRIDMLVGPVTTAVGAAVAEEMARESIPVLLPVLSDDNVTQRHPIEGATRIAGWTASQVTHPLGKWAYDQGYRKVTTLCFDMAFGYEHCGGFVNTFTDAGGQVAKQLWNQLGEQDYATFVTQIRDSNPDAVFVGNSGSDSVRFLQAWSDFGMKGKIPLLTTETVVDQSNLRSMNDNAIGIISAGHYAEGLNSPANEKFVSAFLASTGRLPSYFSAAMYSAADWIVQAIEKVDGKVSDRKAFEAAIRSVQVADSPLGKMKLDEYHHTTQDIYIRKVEKRPDGKLWNAVEHTFPEVSQFWTYDPKEYLKHPAYSRTYQGNGVWPEPQK